MKTVLISDTHGFQKYLTSKGMGKILPEGDLLIHSGDLTGLGRKDEVEEVLQWFKEIASHYTHGIVFIAGNHDKSFDPKFNYLDNQRKKPDWLEEKLASLPNNIHYLENSGLTIEGLKIWGSPITPWFYGDRWAFNKHRGEEINNVWNTIPNDTDVIITHGPPAKIRDFIPSSREYVGCSDLLHRIQVIQPKLVCFGHIHEGYGLQEIDETIFANASICDANYDPTNKPHIIEL
jgi:Icc-related predicted phosphoesterase